MNKWDKPMLHSQSARSAELAVEESAYYYVTIDWMRRMNYCYLARDSALASSSI
jgi:hypothetical protein